jgi:three-Cys-motif partner protein
MEKLPGITEIGIWSEIKLQIVREYAEKFSIVLAKQGRIKHDYIDAFAGAGFHIAKNSKEIIPGSPLNALYVKPPFNELYLIDLDGNKTNILRELTVDHKNVHIFQGNCNEVLLNEVFPKVRYEDYRRALCLLDPYGLHLRWEVIETAAKMKSVEIFLNFPTMDMNRNYLAKSFELANQKDSDRMTAFWGDESWKVAAYDESPQASLFGGAEMEKASNDVVAERFRERLQSVAGFKYVPKPLKIKNTKGATLYYLFFASHNETGYKIARHILDSRRS